MRWSLLVLVMFAMTCSHAGAQDTSEQATADPETSSEATVEVTWLEGQTWQEIVAQATSQEKPILIDFYATWCGPCKMLDKQVYNVPEVVTELAELVTFKVDVDKPEYKELTGQFHIFNFPTLVVCSSDGAEIDRFLGFRPADEFLTIVGDYLAGRNTLADYEARLAQTPDDPELLLTVGSKWAHHLDGERATPSLERVLEIDGDNSRGLAASALLAMAGMDWKQKRWDDAVTTYRRIIDRFPEAEGAEEALHMIAYCQRKSGDTEGMVETYRLMVERNPEDVSALNGFAWNAAKGGIALEEATNIALKAVALSDEDPGIMDTLAEVYHARSMHQDAIVWISKAIAKEPDDDYLKEQLAKFEKAVAGVQP